MSNLAASPSPATAKPGTGLRRQFVSFVVYGIDSAWKLLPAAERQKGKAEFQSIIKRFADEKRAQILTYSTMGMRSKGDLLLWIISPELDAIQDLAAELSGSAMGPYLTREHSFLSMTKRSMYLDRFNPEHQEDRVHLVPGKYKYFFVYPFVKKRQWYLLPLEERQKMMDEHIRTGMKYPSVKLNTTYSFGLDDQDFVVAFETDAPSDFLDLVQELRESGASLYTVRDTPLITCIAKDLGEILDCLG